MAQALQQKTATPVVSPPAPTPSPVRASVPARVQLQSVLRVSSPADPAEKEAVSTAMKVMRMPAPAVGSPVTRGPFVSPYVSRFADAIRLARSATTVARKADGQPNVGANVSSEISSSLASGSPLPLGVRRFMEPRFGADFSGVRIHTGDKAAGLNRQFNAQAFALGNQIFFGRDKFQPETSAGKELIAHELTHTIQQGSVVQRSEAPEVTERTPPHVQRLGLGDALDYFADKANLIPGFRMFTIVLGVNPINMNPVERSAANILRAIVEFIPGGGLITQALDNHGVFEKVGAWIEQQIRSLGLTGAAIKAAVTQFLNTLSWTDIFDLGGVWNRARRIFAEPIDRLISFAKNLIVGILKFIKDAILRPLAKLAEGTRGYDLLKALLGQDPVTGEPVPQNAETLIGGFMKLIGQEEVWANLKKSNAVARAWAWFQGAMAAVLGFVREIPGLFLKAFQSLELLDIVLVPRAFAKLAGVFGSFIGRFISWAGSAVWRLLEIIFEVVSPAALSYIKRTGAALMSILKNPLPFVGNLVKAAKQGFLSFADNIGGHLKSGLIDWLTGSLPGVYIPKAFELGEVVKFVFSVLGISWANVRQKLVKVVGEPVVKAMETGFDIVVTLVTQGPAAAWEKIKEQLTNLKDMVISGITDFVVDTIVKKAIPKLIAMFIPGAGFISAIISIYDTIMVFVQKISKIIQVVTGFIDSIVAIASGAIGPAAKRVESVLASLLSLAISFLAGFLGLGGIADKIMGVINKVRVSVDKAIDALIAWIVKMAKSLFAKAFGKDKKDPLDPEKQKKIDDGIKQLRAEEGRRLKAGKLSFADGRQIAILVKSSNPVFKSFEAFEADGHVKYRYEASPGIVINGPEELPKHDVNLTDIEAPITAPGATSWEMHIFANITNAAGKKERLTWVIINIPMDPELKIPVKPPAPSMYIEGRVPIDGQNRQLRLNGGSITEYALKLIIDRYQSQFGDLTEIHGGLNFDNKALYQIAYADLRFIKNVDEEPARVQALLKTPYGKYRAKLGYDKFQIDLKGFDLATIPKLDPKRKFFVPMSIDVIARR